MRYSYIYHLHIAKQAYYIQLFRCTRQEKKNEVGGDGAQRPRQEEALKMPRYFLARVRNARAPSTAI